MVGHLVDDRPLRPPPHAVRVEVALRVLRVAPGPLLEPVDEALLDLVTFGCSYQIYRVVEKNIPACLNFPAFFVPTDK